MYLRPIFELDEILRQDAHEDSPADGHGESPVELAPAPLTPTLAQTKFERQRTNSDSSTASMDAEDGNSAARSKRQHTKHHLGLLGSSASALNHPPQALFSTDMELYGTQLVNPLSLLSSANIS